MSKPGLPNQIKIFIIETLSSIGQLEVLLLLYRNRGKSWTATEVGEAMKSSKMAAIQQLEELHTKSLVSRLTKNSTSLYEFNASKEQEETVEMLSKYYHDYRVLIVTLIYDKKGGAMQSLADAFKIRKND